MSAKVTEIVSRSLAPLKSLVASLQTVLNNKIDTPETELRAFVDNVDAALKQALQDCTVPAAAAIQDDVQPTSNSTALTQPPSLCRPTIDKERCFNIVVFGVPESPKCFHWTSRAPRDLNSVSSVLANVEDTITSHSI